MQFVLRVAAAGVAVELWLPAVRRWGVLACGKSLDSMVASGIQLSCAALRAPIHAVLTIDVRLFWEAARLYIDEIIEPGTV